MNLMPSQPRQDPWAHREGVWLVQKREWEISGSHFSTLRGPGEAEVTSRLSKELWVVVPGWYTDPATHFNSYRNWSGGLIAQDRELFAPWEFYLAFGCRNLRKQCLGHLSSLHFLLNLIINGSINVHGIIFWFSIPLCSNSSSFDLENMRHFSLWKSYFPLFPSLSSSPLHFTPFIQSFSNILSAFQRINIIRYLWFKQLGNRKTQCILTGECIWNMSYH